MDFSQECLGLGGYRMACCLLKKKADTWTPLGRSKFFCRFFAHFCMTLEHQNAEEKTVENLLCTTRLCKNLCKNLRRSLCKNLTSANASAQNLRTQNHTPKIGKVRRKTPGPRCSFLKPPGKILQNPLHFLAGW